MPSSPCQKREKGRMRVHHLNNVSRALAVLDSHNVKLVNISNEHIVDGSPKLTLGLVWAIILHWQVCMTITICKKSHTYHNISSLWLVIVHG